MIRAGPASPPWREAVAKLRDSGDQGTDEYRLLIEARQNLEVGKEYRQVRPGPGFTRKVLTGVDAAQQSTGGRKVPIAGIVTLLAAAVIVGVVVYVARIISMGSTGSGAVEELAGTYFPTTVASANFNGVLPDDWRRIGELKLATTGGYLHMPIGATSADGSLGGGIVLPQPLPGDEPFSTQAAVHPGTAQAGDQLGELFVSTTPDFSADRATGPHELVWLIRGQTQQVVLDGQVVADRPIPKLPAQMLLNVRIIMNKDLALVEANHERLWAGPHGLGDGPRYVGVRILTTAPGVVGTSAEPAIMDWKVSK
jgi:hypothetical protein